MKKNIILTVLSLILAFSLVACGNNTKKESVKEETKKEETKKEQAKKEAKEVKAEKKKVTVTTSFISDMVNVLVGDKVETQMIVPAGEDPHLYVAKPEDMKKIQSADLLLYHGLHFEGKMKEVLEKTGIAITKNLKEEDLKKFLGLEKGSEVDPHFWFNIDFYKKAFEEAKNQLVKLLPEEKETIEKNYTKYISELDKLHKENKEKIAQIPEKSRFLITPHDAFSYFGKLYGINIMAPQGISTDSEVANKELEETAEFIAKNKVKAIFAESTTNPDRMKKMQQIVKSKGFDVKVVSGEGKELYSDSLAPKGQKGDTFLDMYRHNVNLIVENLK